MDIGVVIKKYRKEAGMTQEEMANRLGVTTPAVNKWENSNSKPDIELLAPIARLLDISLDTLLSFHEKLSDTEIEEIIRKMDRMFSEEGYEKTYEWALRLIKEYPNCNMLIWQTAVMLDARRITDKCTNQEKYDKQINAWYELALHDENEEIQHHAAEEIVLKELIYTQKRGRQHFDCRPLVIYGYFFSNSLQFFWLYPMVLTTNEIPKIITATIAATIIYE